MLGRLLASNRRLRALADQDPLTGTLNRRGLKRCLERLCHGQPSLVAPVLLVDCDDFKAINEHHGHAVGDAVLVELVHRMRSCVRDRDPVARLGGDEFIVLLPHTNVAAAERIGRQICDRVAASPVSVGTSSVELTVSIGVAEATLAEPSVEPLLSATRAALRKSKSEGKNRASSRAGDSGRVARPPDAPLLPSLGTCTVVGQPLVSLTAGAIVGRELWIRGPSAELRAPADLFRAARQAGAETLVDLACLRCTAREALLDPHVKRVHLNLLPGTAAMEPDAVAGILKPLCDRGTPVVVEMSLERLGRCSDALLESARVLRHAGVRLALEHAGHGSTSLDAILALSPELLKIRREWTAALGDGHPEAIRRARALRHMADALGFELVALGVERVAELDAVRALGFATAQGELFSPMGARRST
jgi:diguanylate cyclase (GGDEF)-like protein